MKWIGWLALTVVALAGAGCLNSQTAALPDPRTSRAAPPMPPPAPVMAADINAENRREQARRLREELQREMQPPQGAER